MTPEQKKAKELVDKYINKKKGTIPFPELLPKLPPMSDAAVAFGMSLGVDPYKMGIDEGGFDGNTFTLCVINNKGCVASYKSRNQDDFRKAVEQVSKYYNIQPNQMLKETE